MSNFTENWMFAKILNRNLNFQKMWGSTHSQKNEKRIDITFERVSIVCALAQLTQIENV